MPGPLDGIRVIDCSTVLAGPYCTMVLADLGADVIKVEPPAGDATRSWGPPWVGDEAAGTRTAAYYLAINRNKRSVRLDLRQEAGRSVLWRLLEDADLVVENFRVGGFARLGFSDDALAARNPGLIHLGISGYGPIGPDAPKPGYDFVVQAVSGLMSITGEPDGGPMKVGVAISDVATGLFAAIGALGALLGRQREVPGDEAPARGGRRVRRVDTSILESTLAVLVNQAQNAFVTGLAPKRRGNAHPSIVPYETFHTADGTIAIGVGSERQWRALCEAVGRPELATEARFATNAGRVDHRTELIPLLAEAFADASSATWLARLDEAGVPCGPILDVVAAFESPQALALGSRVAVRHPRLGAVDQVANPLRLDARPLPVASAPPLLGEHDREILAEIGYSPEEIDELLASSG
jgi:crotonobetainyl-CoA:carnitine CoA-transferase CaiB-like acyl-CoA transferase